MLLEGLDVLVAELDLALETGDLTRIAGHGELLGLLGVLVGTLKLLELLLETEDLEDHNVGAVKDQGEEEGEAAKVHVALRVELASLDFETLVTHDGSTVDSGQLSVAYKGRKQQVYVRVALGGIGGSGKLDLHTVDSVHAVDKQDEDEYERDL